AFLAAIAGPIIGYMWLLRLGKKHKIPVKELQEVLANRFTVADMNIIINRLKIPLTEPLDGKLQPDRNQLLHQQRLASEMIEWARNRDRLPQLREAMRSINPEALHWL
ncbi:MAG TPA: hypothetical protein VF528_05295, partial [Pyrinomonadaceae bacterium]